MLLVGGLLRLAGRGMSHAPRPRIFVALLSLCIYCTVSANLLTAFGSHYVSDGGTLLEKIHPASMLIILAGLCCIGADAHGLAGIRRLVRRHRLLGIFLAGIAFCIIYALAFTGTGGLIALIDSFLPAGLLAIMLADADRDDLRAVRRLVQTLVVMNAVIALAETAAQQHLLPPPPGLPTAEFRALALYDHPLTGAMASMLGWMLRPDFERAPLASMAYQGLVAASLVAFGERAPVLLVLCTVGWTSMQGLTGRIVLRRFRARESGMVLLTALAVNVLLVAAVVNGWAERLSAHLYWDASAGVRLSAFHILGMLSTPELVFGARREDVIALLEPLRLTYHVAVIEDFWLVMLITLGGLGFPVFVLSMGALLRWLWRYSGRSGHVMIVTLVIATSTSNSLGRKSMLLTFLVFCVLATRAVHVPRASARMTRLAGSLA